jgi:hypothetical protein
MCCKQKDTKEQYRNGCGLLQNTNTVLTRNSLTTRLSQSRRVILERNYIQDIPKSRDKWYPLVFMERHEANLSTNETLRLMWPLFPGIRPSLYIASEKGWLLLQTGRRNGACDGRSTTESGGRGKVASTIMSMTCLSIQLTKTFDNNQIFPCLFYN